MTPRRGSLAGTGGARRGCAPLAAALLVLAGAAAAQEMRLSLPIACTLGTDCHIQQFVDHDPGPGAMDFTCGPLVYDGHRGTDFALPSLADQARGVAVLAAAPGVVSGVRNNMPDILQGSPGAPDVAGRDCGNGVVIRHDDGWETQYCHLARGSVSVSPGETVATGAPLGRVGLSGRTEFPHLHLSVRRDGAVVDPFAPDGVTGCDASPQATLWSDPPAVRPGGLITTGITDAVPDYERIKAGGPLPAPRRDSPLVAWGHIFGGRAGDTVAITLTGPDGEEILAHEERLERDQAQLFRAAGRRAPPAGWAPGAYGATIRLIRDRSELDRRDAAITLPR